MADWWQDGAGTVVRRYDYLADASDEMNAAQLTGWTVRHVYVRGKELEPTTGSSWLKELWSTRLIETGGGRLQLRRLPALWNGRWRHLLDALGGGASELDAIEVVFARGGADEERISG